MLLTAIWLGFTLDAVFGDPQGLWHPVCAIGSLITRTERFLRRFAHTPAALRLAGVLLWLVPCAVSFLVPLAILRLCAWMHPLLALAVETIFCCQISARRCLADAGRDVETALGHSLADGREAVGRYVGRNTDALTETGVIKAAVETIAENTSDGVIAPLFWMMLGGAPLGFLYKAVNTLDSMVGYRNEKYENLGKCAAKMDDLFNFVPARLSALCMTAAAPLCGLDGKNAWRIFVRDRNKHKSPNAGQTESVCAGALHVLLAGDAVYFGQTVKKATLGDDDRPIERADIGRSSRLMTAASMLALAAFSAVRLAVCCGIG